MADTIAYLLVTTEPGRAKDVARSVAALDGVHWVAEVSGPYELIVGAKLSDRLGLSRLESQIDGLPGVSDTATALLSSFRAGRGVAGLIEPP